MDRTFTKPRSVSMTKEQPLTPTTETNESWTLDEFKHGKRAQDEHTGAELDDQIAPIKTRSAPVSRRVGMTRRPMTAVFAGTRQPSSDVTVGSAAPAHVSAGRHMARGHRTGQPSSDATVGAQAPDHVGAAGRPRRSHRAGHVRRQHPHPHQHTRAHPRSPSRFEQRLINELQQLRHENERLRQVNAERTHFLARMMTPEPEPEHPAQESADMDAEFFLPRYLRA